MNTSMKALSAASAAALIFFISLAIPVPVQAQEHGNDPAFQKAREETVIITDLGRLFGFLLRMDKEEDSLRISNQQARELSRMAEEIQVTDRLTPSRAKAMLLEIEDNILSPAQLLYTDRLFTNRDMARTPGTRTGSEGGGPGTPGAGSSGAAGQSPGGGSIATFIAGGPFNPLLDTSRQQGKDFQEFRSLVRERARS